MEQVDVADIVSTALASFSRQIKQKQLHTTLTLPEKSIQIPGNPVLLRQLFSNLIDNAVKYTNEEGTINVDVKTNDQMVITTIKDNGIGIEDNEQSKIFDRFYRVDTSRSQTQGYGLGLSICRTIVDIHKGKLLVNSKKNKGSTFTVILPV